MLLFHVSGVCVDLCGVVGQISPPSWSFFPPSSTPLLCTLGFREIVCEVGCVLWALEISGPGQGSYVGLT